MVVFMKRVDLIKRNHVSRLNFEGFKEPSVMVEESIYHLEYRAVLADDSKGIG